MAILFPDDTVLVWLLMVMKGSLQLPCRGQVILDLAVLRRVLSAIGTIKPIFLFLIFIHYSSPLLHFCFFPLCGILVPVFFTTQIPTIPIKPLYNMICCL